MLKIGAISENLLSDDNGTEMSHSMSKKLTTFNVFDHLRKRGGSGKLHVIHAVEKNGHEVLNVSIATHLLFPLTLPHNNQSVAQTRHVGIFLKHLLVKLTHTRPV